MTKHYKAIQLQTIKKMLISQTELSQDLQAYKYRLNQVIQR